MPKPITSLALHADTAAARRTSIYRLLAGLGQSLRAALQAYKSRRALREIAALDDRMLRDVGLTRADVTRAILRGDEEDPVRPLKDARFINATHRFRG